MISFENQVIFERRGIAYSSCSIWWSDGGYRTSNTGDVVSGGWGSKAHRKLQLVTGGLSEVDQLKLSGQDGISDLICRIGQA